MITGVEGCLRLFALGVFAVSWSAILVRFAAVPGPVSAFWRMALAALVLLVWSSAVRPGWLTWKQLLWAGSGGVFFAADLALFNTAANHANAANVTALGNNTPIFAGLLSWMLWGRKPSLRLWIGLACAFAGTLVLAGGDARLSAEAGAADLMAFGSIAVFCSLSTGDRAGPRRDRYAAISDDRAPGVGYFPALIQRDSRVIALGQWSAIVGGNSGIGPSAPIERATWRSPTRWDISRQPPSRLD